MNVSPGLRLSASAADLPGEAPVPVMRLVVFRWEYKEVNVGFGVCIRREGAEGVDGLLVGTNQTKSSLLGHYLIHCFSMQRCGGPSMDFCTVV